MALFPVVGRKQTHVRIAWWLVVVLLCLGVLLHLFPFYFMIVTSFKDGAETLASPPTWWPQHPTLAAWRLVLSVAAGTNGLLDQPFYVYLFNSLFMAGMILIISLPITSLSAYATSKLLRGPMARWSFLFFISTLMLPAAVTLLPTLLLTLNFPFAIPQGSIPNIPGTNQPFPTIQIWDTPWAVILPACFNAFNFLLFKGYFDSIPDSVIQAARVDGGTELNIFRRIVLPMSIPVYAVATWIQFSAVWDNFLWPSLAFRSPEKLPTSVAIYNLINKFTVAGATDANQALGQSEALKHVLNAGLTWNGLMVLGLIQTLPIFFMFILCREYLLSGIKIRGLK
jgi:multiple sugar transport system permease protein